jgi:hypothetical protein
MALLEKIVLKDTVTIRTTPEKIWQFWADMDKNYKSWHPEDHILFRWTKGKPMSEGSTVYGEEVVGGKLLKLKLTCADVVPGRKFALKYSFPASLFCKYEYLIEPEGTNTTFTAITYLKYPRFARKRMQTVIEVGKKHVREEGENLKKLLEQS